MKWEGDWAVVGGTCTTREPFSENEWNVTQGNKNRNDERTVERLAERLRFLMAW